MFNEVFDLQPTSWPMRKEPRLPQPDIFCRPFLDCGGKRSATPFWFPALRRRSRINARRLIHSGQTRRGKNAVAAALCRRSPNAATGRRQLFILFSVGARPLIWRCSQFAHRKIAHVVDRRKIQTTCQGAAVSFCCERVVCLPDCFAVFNSAGRNSI